MSKVSKVLCIGGPNGSGKSTITAKIPVFGEYVNADEIQRHLQCSPLEAAEIAKKTRENFLSVETDFTFESVLSTSRNYDLLAEAKATGRYIAGIFILTSDPAINIARVKKRIAQGGHEAPLEKVKPRYIRSLNLFPQLFELCDELYVYDNSADRAEGEPSRILSFVHGTLELFPNETWSLDMLEALIDGKYCEKYVH